MVYAAPKGYTPDVCIYHHPCADGLTAAWVTRRRWPSCKMVPQSHGKQTDFQAYAGKHVLMVDFSLPTEELCHLASVAASLTILDHHESAERRLGELLKDGTIQGIFDMKKSGAMLAHDFAFPDREAPEIIQYVQDRDLWTWALPYSHEISAWMQTKSLTFEAWDEIAATFRSPTARSMAISTGAVLIEKRETDIAMIIKATKREMVIGGYTVPVINAPHILSSEAGNVLSKGVPFAAVYFDATTGERNFSLRSDKNDPNAVNVSLIAQHYGGGGHANASGFKMPKGWEGE